MKHFLLAGFLAAALVLSACEQQSGINAPVTSSKTVSLAKTLEALNLSSEQAAQITDVFYMGNDLNVILDPAQVTTFNGMVGDGNTVLDDRKIGPRFYFDMEAVMWFRLVLKANPEMTEEQKQQVKEAIDASNARRKEIIANPALTPEEKKAQLQTEHDALMLTLNGIFTAEQLDKAKALKEQLEQERKDRQEKWAETLILRQVAMWTKALGLTAEQQELLKEILKGQNTELARLREEFKGNPAGYRTAIQELQKATDAAIRLILTEEQAAIWDKLHQKRTGGGGKVDPIKAQVDMLTRQLTLTTDQADKVTKILIGKEEQKKIFAEKYKGDPAGFRAAMEKLEKDTNASIRETLTPEQQTIWDKMHRTGGRTGG
ncbi:MAG: hypothetical protein IPP94_05725 [Ignavibacteria bacterium]|nr:hypothetical protein [Ignavibacteria bacterium]